MYMKRLVLLLTNIYWIFNIVILLVLTYYSHNYCNCGVIHHTQLYSERLTWFGIITALWISGLTVIVFILTKTNEIIYGIKFSNILIWQVTFPGVIGAGIVYAALFPWGFWACFCGTDSCIIVDIFLIFTWLIGVSFFVIYYSKKTNAFKAIKCNTYERIKKICSSCVDFDTDYLGRINQLPLMKMIRGMDHDDSEETQRVKDCLTGICNLFNEENIMYQYFILMPIVSSYCEKAGCKKRYEAANTTDFFSDLLRHHWNAKNQLWIRAGIILPIAEKWRGSNSEIDIVNILKHFPWSDRQELVVIILLYIEYLFCCGDVDDKCIAALKKLEFSRVIHEFAINKNTENTLCEFWISWNLLDHQETYRLEVFRNFIYDWHNWSNEISVCQTWILRRLMWEETVK